MKNKPTNKNMARVTAEKKAHLYRRVVIWAIFIITSTMILAINLLPAQVSLKEGEIAPDDIYFNETSSSVYTSQIRTLEAIEQAAESVSQIYSVNTTTSNNLLKSVRDNFTSIATTRDDDSLDMDAKLFVLRDMLPGAYSDEILGFMLELSDDELQTVENILTGVIIATYVSGVAEGEIDTARESMITELTNIDLEPNALIFCRYFLENTELPYNLVYDPDLTTAAIEEAKDHVAQVQVTVQPGEKLVSKGAPVTEEQIEALLALGIQGINDQIIPYIGLFGIVLLMYLLAILYINFYQPKIRDQDKKIVLLGVIITFTIILCKLISFINISPTDSFSSQIGYLLPIAGTAILISLLLGRGLAIISTMFLAILASIIYGNDLSYAVVAVAGGLAGVFSTKNLNQGSQFVTASFYIMLANSLFIGSWGLLSNHSYGQIGAGLVIGIGNAFISIIIARGVLPFLESGFGITTVTKLLELSNFNHPLLKRLMMEAPGTYHHSVLVGNLAEAAADAIEADPLLVRVASYYHDIGKLRRPYFFIENQSSGGDNPHDKLQPALSAMIITSHVKDGVEMLREAKFPAEIIDIVEQHHGQGLLTFFYNKALENVENSEEIKKDDFRYRTPKPMTKEAALVMLADSVQAAVQMVITPSKGEMEEIVEKVIKTKADSGQLQDCHLTFKDLGTISQAFIMVLSGMHHSRTGYIPAPPEPKPEEPIIEAEG